MEKKEQNINQYHKFRSQYPEFIYDGYEASLKEEMLEIIYHFHIPGLAEFSPSWKFPRGSFKEKELTSRLKDMIFYLGMVELVSYWKITCSPKVMVKAGFLDAKQILWWKDLYFNGLGEFFYVNGIRDACPEGFMEIEAEFQKDQEPWFSSFQAPETEHTGRERVLVPIGGGKDSAVTLELLKEAGASCYGYVINPRGATLHTAEAAGLSQGSVIAVKRTLDPNMLKLNQQGFLNGHTPFSAVVAFSSLIAAELYGLPYIALSNESSANESTVSGSTVNHQYSKSFPFEKAFHEYVKAYLPGSSQYFSLLRPLSEFQIARYFAEKKQYHNIFRSCNVGSKEDKWCGHCPKCLFVFLILSPFLSREEIIRIFGRDMLMDDSLYPVFEQLIGLQEEKPFECVGSRDEVNTAIMLTIRQLEKEEKPLPQLLKRYQETGLYERYQAAGDRYSTYFDEDNLVPEPWRSLVQRQCCYEGAQVRI